MDGERSSFFRHDRIGLERARSLPPSVVSKLTMLGSNYYELSYIVTLTS